MDYLKKLKAVKLEIKDKRQVDCPVLYDCEITFNCFAIVIIQTSAGKSYSLRG